MTAVYHLEVTLPEGETPRDMRIRMEKFFTYYHPNYKVVVTSDASNAEPAEEPSDEALALLGLDEAVVDLLS